MSGKHPHVGGGWFRYWDENEDSFYYHHPVKGETTWDLPPECDEKGVESEAQPGQLEVSGTVPQTEPSEAIAGRDVEEGSSAGLGEPETPAQNDDEKSSAEENAESAQRSDADADSAGVSGSDFDWEAYAKANGYGSAQEAYAAYYHFYYGGGGGGGGAQWQWGPHGWYQSGGWDSHGAWGPTAAAPHGGGEADQAAQLHAATSGGGGGGGGVIYEPGHVAGQGRAAAAETAAERLERLLGKGPEGEATEDGPGDGELTEAQKIFGTGESFTVHAGLRATAIDPPPADGAPVVVPVTGVTGGPVTAEQIAASARELQARTLDGSSSVVINPSDMARHGTVAVSAARDAVMLNAVNQTQGGADPYRVTATFNKRTGRFEGSGQVLKMSVNDPRRQTSHYFDYDKWAEEKSAAKGRRTKQPRTS